VFISGAPLFTIMLGGTALGAFFSSRGFTIGFDGAINKMFGISGRDEIEVLSTIRCSSSRATCSQRPRPPTASSASPTR